MAEEPEEVEGPESEPVPNLTPAQVSAENLVAKGVLDYQPDFSVPPNPAAPAGTVPTPVQAGVEQSAITDHLLNVIATVRDSLVVQKHLTSVLATLQADLQTVSAVANPDVLSPADYAYLTAIGKTTITFSDLQTALTSPSAPGSTAIVTSWLNYNWGINGRIDAFVYPALVQYQPYISNVVDLSQRVAALQSYNLGNTSGDVLSNVTNITAAVTYNASYVNAEQVDGYVKAQDALSGSTSEAAYSIQNIVNAVNVNQTIPTDGFNLAVGLQPVFFGGGPTGGGIGEVISILQTLETVFQVFAASSWLSVAGIEAQLLALGDEILMLFEGQAMAAFAHIQSELLSPILGLVRYGSGLGGGIGGAAVNGMFAAVTGLLDGVVGKFNKYALDFFRMAQQQTQATNTQTGSADVNNRLRNLIKVLNELISVLQKAESIASGNWLGIAASLQGNLQGQIVSSLLPSVPSLAISRPPINSDILTVVSGPVSGQSWGNVATGGNPAAAASSLLNDVTGLV